MASFFVSLSNRSPNPKEIRRPSPSSEPKVAHRHGTNDEPLHNVLPPLRTMLEYKFFRRSMSTRVIESTITWCTPAYSIPMISGLKRISGARNFSAPSYFPNFENWNTLEKIEKDRHTRTEFPSGNRKSSHFPAMSFSSFAGLSAT